MNVRAGGNELDLVVRRGSQLVFCEVKMRSRVDFGEAVEMVGPEKQRRLRHAADCWLAVHPELEELEMSFEIVGIHAEGIERVREAF
jgi:putative endonuclease